MRVCSAVCPTALTVCRFNIYIYDYCFKRGFKKTARELLSEAEIPAESQPPINAKQGLLFEWWSVFWVLFTAKANGTGSEEALLYTSVRRLFYYLLGFSVSQSAFSTKMHNNCNDRRICGLAYPLRPHRSTTSIQDTHPISTTFRPTNSRLPIRRNCKVRHDHR